MAEALCNLCSPTRSWHSQNPPRHQGALDGSHFDFIFHLPLKRSAPRWKICLPRSRCRLHLRSAVCFRGWKRRRITNCSADCADDFAGDFASGLAADFAGDIAGDLAGDFAAGLAADDLAGRTSLWLWGCVVCKRSRSPTLGAWWFLGRASLWLGGCVRLHREPAGTRSDRLTPSAHRHPLTSASIIRVLWNLLLELEYDWPVVFQLQVIYLQCACSEAGSVTQSSCVQQWHEYARFVETLIGALETRVETHVETLANTVEPLKYLVGF